MDTALLVAVVLRGGMARQQPTYLFRDTFTTPDDAPVTSPRTCEPGPGALTFTDASNRYSISGGDLVLASGITAAAGAVSGNIVLAIGRAAVFDCAASLLEYFGWTNAAMYLGNNLQAESVAIGATYSSAAMFAVVLRNTGYWFVNLTTNELLFTSPANRANYNVSVGTGGLTTSSFTGSIHEIYVADMTGVWATQFGPATSYVALPSNGEIITQAADGQVEVEWTTPASGGTLDLQFRRVDDDNCLIVRCDQAGSTVKLIKKEGGSESELDSKAQTWTAANRYIVTALCNGSNVRTFTRNYSGGLSRWLAHVAKANVTNTFQQTSTGAKVVNADVLADFVAWPRTIEAPSFS